MESDRMIQAVGRIERALSRIEASRDTIADTGAVDEIQTRYDALKQDMREAVAKIDNLIASQKG